VLASLRSAWHLRRSLGGGGKPIFSHARAELALEGVCVEALRLPALFTLDQCRANYFDFCAALLFAPNEITDVFAIVGVLATSTCALTQYLAGPST